MSAVPGRPTDVVPDWYRTSHSPPETDYEIRFNGIRYYNLRLWPRT